jgi:hypothetical protein
MFHDKAALMIGGRKQAAGRADHRQSDRVGSRLHAPVHAGEPGRSSAQRNADHGADDVRLFEAGPVYPGDKPKTSACMWPPS